jgi:hypothetical protein
VRFPPLPRDGRRVAGKEFVGAGAERESREDFVGGEWTGKWVQTGTAKRRAWPGNPRTRRPNLKT